MTEQILLFQDEYVLLNDAVAALTALNLDVAVTAFQNYRDLYHGQNDVDRMLLIADFLRQGLASCPETGPERPVRLFAFWKSFETDIPARQGVCEEIVSRIRLSFFRLLAQAIKDAEMPDSAFLSPQIPAGYVYLQTGQHDRAIRSLQASLAVSPGNAAVYGYLGDAYSLRGETDVARQVYLEACLIDPDAIDWDHLKDGALTELKGQIADEHAYGETLLRQWLPSHAYVQGLFRPKQIRLRDEFKAFVGGYLALEETGRRDPSPIRNARLFLQGIVLCDNEPFLRLIKGIDFADVRRKMKEANAPLFAAYLRYIERRHSRQPVP